MTQEKVKQLKRLAVLMLGAFVVSGCPSQTASNLLASSASLSQEAVAQEAVAPLAGTEDTGAQIESAEVSFEVCADVADWQRPSEDEQSKQIGSDARYSEALSDAGDPLKRESSQFWDHQIISFTTYGLSARMEPVNLSGLWTVADDLWSCYDPETTVAINEGDRAETWLLNHRISSIEWQGDRYVMTVEPADAGVQVVQFARVDQLASLPLEVVTADGESVAVTSGDWQ